MEKKYFWTSDKSQVSRPLLDLDDDADNAVDVANCGMGPPDDGEWLAKVTGVGHEVVHPKGAKPFHRVCVDFSVPVDLAAGMEYCFSKEFDLNAASRVAEARRFFALFDFPLAGPRDVAAACQRACQGFCRVRISRQGRDHAHVEVVELVRKRMDTPPPDDGKDVWNHECHWTRDALWVGDWFPKEED